MTIPISYDALNQILFEQSPDGIFIDDSEGNIWEVNTTLCNWLGYSRSEVKKLHISDLIGKEALKQDPLQHADLKSGKTVVKERRFKRKNGTYLPVELTARSIPDGKILVHVRDITHRIRLAEISKTIHEFQSQLLHLTDLEEIYRIVAQKIYDIITDGIVITSMLDEVTGTLRIISFIGLDVSLEKIMQLAGFDLLKEEYRLDRMSEEEMELFRCGRFVKVEEGIHALSTRRISKPVAHAIEKLLRVEAVYTVGFVWNGKHLGGLFILSRGGVEKYKDNISLIMNQASTTINRIRAEKALFESESGYRRLMKIASEGIWQMDVMHNTVFVNARMAEMLGYEVQEMLGKNVRSFLFDEELKDYLHRLELCRSGKNDPYERRFHKKDGGVLWTIVSANAIHNSEGGFIGFFAMFTDITHIKLTHSRLQESEERLNVLINSSPDIVCFKDAQGRWLNANRSILDLYGLTNVDYRNKSEYELPDYTFPVFQEAFRNCQGSDDNAWEKGSLFRTEELIPDSAGNLHFFDVIKVPLYHPDGSRKGLIVYGRDISERKKSEEILLQSEEKYRQIADNTSDVIWMMDIKMRYTYVSPSIFRQRGYTPEEFLRLKPAEIYTEDSLKKAVEIYLVYRDMAKKGELSRDFSLTVELEHRCKNGSTRFSEVMLNVIFDQGNRPTGVHGVSRDISDRKLAEEKTREAEERFRLAFQTSPDSININRMEDGTYIEINDGFTKLTGYTAEEVIGRTSIEVDIWADVERRDDLVKMLKEQTTVSNFEARFRYKDGTVRTGLMSAAVILLKGKKHIISITRDIEELIQTGIELKQAKERAEEVSRLKTAFLNNISHEIRTPMNAILGFTDLLQSEENTREEKDKYFGIINSSSRQLLSIIDDVLEISRMDSGRIPVNLVDFSLSELMHDIYFSISGLIRKKDLRIVCSQCKPTAGDRIFADREKIRQIINGLTDNALKNTREGEISFGYILKNGLVEFFVRDTGIGIEKHEQEKIFERFYQVKRVGIHDARGTGLGLSIARGLVEMMEGEIHVESELGKGSVFSFSIPLHKVAYTSPRVEVAEKLFLFSGLTILIAEDEEYNYEYLHILLSRKVKEILWAKNGSEVLSLLENKHADLILMDLKMPVMNGIDATRQLKKNNPQLPVIALTAYTQPEDERNAMQAGCSAFVCKPIRQQELFDTIRRVMD